MPVLKLPVGQHDAQVTDWLLTNWDQPNLRIVGEGIGNTFINAPVMFHLWGCGIEGVTLWHPDLWRLDTAGNFPAHHNNSSVNQHIDSLLQNCPWRTP